MEFLKNHYEKVVLGVVLLALAGVAVWLPVKIQSDKQVVAGTLAKYDAITAPPKLEPLDISKAEETSKQKDHPPTADFSGAHNLVNPVRWIKTPDGAFEKHVDGEAGGAKRLQVTAIKPLSFIVKYDKVSGAGYSFLVTREAAEKAPDRRPRIFYASPRAAKNEVFTLHDVRGPEDNPIAFELEINETSERIVVSNSKEYVATNGYSAEISFPLEKRNWKEVRAKQPLVFAGDTNIVVDINPSEVIIRAVSNEKTTTIPFNAVP